MAHLNLQDPPHRITSYNVCYTKLLREFHAPGKFNKVTGELLDCECAMNKPPKFQNVFGNTLVELAEKNEKIVGVTPAMPSGSSLNIMREKMPDRAFDVGISYNFV